MVSKKLCVTSMRSYFVPLCLQGGLLIWRSLAWVITHTTHQEQQTDMTWGGHEIEHIWEYKKRIVKVSKRMSNDIMRKCITSFSRALLFPKVLTTHYNHFSPFFPHSLHHSFSPEESTLTFSLSFMDFTEYLHRSVATSICYFFIPFVFPLPLSSFLLISPPLWVAGFLRLWNCCGPQPPL